MKLKILFLFLFLITNKYIFCEYYYESDYDILMEHLNINRSNDIIKLFEDGISRYETGKDMITRETGLKITISTLKRIGELNININNRIKDIIKRYMPFRKIEESKANSIYLFNMALWTYLKLGNDNEIKYILNFILPNIINNPKYVETLTFIIRGLGEAKDSKIALDYLHKLLIETDNEIIGTEIVNSIVKHKKTISIAFLLDKKKTLTLKFSPKFIKLIDESIEEIGK